MLLHHALILLLFVHTVSFAQDSRPTKQDVQDALRKAVTFYSEVISIEGGYLWNYSADLAKKEGEGKVGDTTAWLQSPGTPYIGETYIELYELTGDSFYLNKAKETAMALVKGQLHSGGWDHRIEFAPEDRQKYAYRVDNPTPGKKQNRSTLDDDKTQSALRFLTRYDQTTDFKDTVVHEAVTYGLEKLIEAQFPNGGWSHAFIDKPDPSKHPVKQADYREDGDPYSHIKSYWEHYTLNDNLQSDVIDTLALAAQTYQKEAYWNALKKAGDFLILAQMPEPQPGWAQQYDYDMHPAWARKFEPVSISAGESQNVMMSLMDLYEITGEPRYLAPIPKALQYYQTCILEDGRLARFYELKTNKPLYFTKDYQLTYSDADLPTHYAFKINSRLENIGKRYQKLKKQDWTPPKETTKEIAKPSPQAINTIINALDERGAWVEDGRMRYWGDDDMTSRIINPRTFVRNTVTLAQYLHHLK